VSRPALGPTQPPVQWVPGVLSPGLKRGRSVTLITHPYLMPRSRVSRSYTSSPPSAFMACNWTALACIRVLTKLNVIIIIIMTIAHFRWTASHNGIACSQISNERRGLYVRILASNILNTRTADKGCFGLGVGWGPNILLGKKMLHWTRSWTDYLKLKSVQLLNNILPRGTPSLMNALYKEFLSLAELNKILIFFPYFSYSFTPSLSYFSFFLL
jgi:hypothetical protein